MVVTVNGERHEVEAANVAALLEALGYEGSFFAVAVNQEVIRRANWTETPLAEGDSVEILTPRQGG
ncbi:sulfur carrier protein ThiS [Enterovirga sp. CN4-39]|uniref:sulfur carrier protein ThiS n=1 Tax=Enterovirga sp. CN4-39 TaxID=3400910 RepID=UPI003C0CC46F